MKTFLISGSIVDTDADKFTFEDVTPTQVSSFLDKLEDGEEVECDVLFTFDSDETGKSYIAYTDNTKDENGNVQVYASIYNPEEAETKLLPIESEKEWKIIETILEEIQASAPNMESSEQ